MRTFTTGTGENTKTWELKLTVASLERVHRHVQVDLMNPKDEKFLALFMDDRRLQGAVTWVLCEKAAMRDGYTEADFLEDMDKDAANEAVELLKEELVEFYPEEKVEGLKKYLAKAREVGVATIQLANEKLEALDVAKLAEQVVQNLDLPETT